MIRRLRLCNKSSQKLSSSGVIRKKLGLRNIKIIFISFDAYWLDDYDYAIKVHKSCLVPGVIRKKRKLCNIEKMKICFHWLLGYYATYRDHRYVKLKLGAWPFQWTYRIRRTMSGSWVIRKKREKNAFLINYSAVTPRKFTIYRSN